MGTTGLAQAKDPTRRFSVALLFGQAAIAPMYKLPSTGLYLIIFYIQKMIKHINNKLY